MSDQHKKKEGKNDIELPFLNEQASEITTGEGLQTDHLQDDFNALIADPDAISSHSSDAQDATPHDSYSELSDHLTLQSQDSAAEIPEDFSSQPGTTSGQQESIPYEEASDAFNDLADAFTLDSTSSTESDLPSHLDQSFQEHDSTPDQASIANDNFPAFDADEYTPTSSQPISGDAIPNQGSSALFENESPTYADLSGTDHEASPSKVLMMAIATVVLIAAGGGFYWYSTSSPTQPVKIMKAEQLKSPAQRDEISAKKPTENIPVSPAMVKSKTAPNTTLNSSNQVEKSIPTSLSTADAIKLLTQQRAKKTELTSPLPAKPETSTETKLVTPALTARTTPVQKPATLAVKKVTSKQAINAKKQAFPTKAPVAKTMRPETIAKQTTKPTVKTEPFQQILAVDLDLLLATPIEQ